MANLSISEITRDGKEYRSTLLVEKVFEKNGKTNNFMTDSGLFHATSIIVDNKEYKTFSKNIENFIMSLRGMRGKNIFLKGKLSGKKTFTNIPLTKVEKSEEFGGQPAGGKKENRGILFEKDLYERFRECIQAKTCKGKYDRQAMKILEMASKANGSPVENVEPVGGQNQPRPLILQGGDPIINPPNPSDHGKLLTDLNLIHKDKTKSYLSLKFSSTLTFINSGVAKKYFPEAEMKTGKLTNPLGNKILEVLGIENEKFCKVFNDYGKGGKMIDPHVVNVTSVVNKPKLKKLLKTAIGANYWMVHGMEGNKVYFWEMSKKLNDSFASINGDIILYYGGTNGTGKRIDMTFSNNYFEFKLNIRNKQSGIYPSHLMLDYKSLPPTGKTLL